MIFARSDGDFSPCAAIEVYGLLPGDLIRMGVFGVFLGLPCLVADLEETAHIADICFCWLAPLPTFRSRTGCRR